MKKIYLIRHGSTEWNEKKIINGRTDISLSKFGEKQAIITASFLYTFFDNTTKNYIFSSPLVRSIQTATYLSKICHIPIFENTLLIERDYGAFENQSMEKVDWKKIPGDMEDGVSTLTRASMFIDLLQNNYSEGVYFVFSHGNTIRNILYILTGKNYSTVKNCSISQIIIDDFDVVYIEENLNSIKHLKEVDEGFK